jgi:alpha-mannosidase
MLEIGNDDVVLTAMKPGPDGSTVLRVYDASGRGAKDVRIHMHATIADAHESNLMEDEGQAMKVENDTLAFDLHPFEIRTLRTKIALGRR